MDQAERHRLEDALDCVASWKAEALLYKAILNEARRAIGDHYAPEDCYVTGPLTGDGHRDFVQCPACSFIAMYEAATAKAIQP
jgi:hypothetical protein